MIKHRFILRDKDDFRIFAAIPVETHVLTWKTWTRPPEWDTLREVCAHAISFYELLAKRWSDVADCYAQLAELDVSLVETKALTKEELAENVDLAHTIADFVAPRKGQAMEARKIADMAFLNVDVLHKRALTLVAPLDAVYEVYVETTDALLEEIKPLALADDDGLNLLIAGARAHIKRYREFVSEIPTRFKRKDAQQAARDVANVLGGVYETIAELVLSILRDKRVALDLTERVNNIRLLCNTPHEKIACPPGIPFAAYTVEFDGTVVEVVEGCAWVSHRAAVPAENMPKLKAVLKRIVVADKSIAPAGRTDAALDQALEYANAMVRTPVTEDERRVVEIVTQMLTERSLNPRADTRVPVREIDPAHAAETRRAEMRPGPPKLRTIKFGVSPPRYLREAAEHILTSPRRAHWVIGHWRNQVWGEKRAQRRQTWIKPHIRGLGEASATTSSVVAPR